jgi:glutathione synthase/RimK-type ligase-like ATP-grasp enzyme
MASSRVALITTSPEAMTHDADLDMEVLVQALAAVGVEAIPTVWDDAAVEWGAFDLLLIRSPWDYSGRSEEFLAWLAGASAQAPLLNPPEVIRWNLDKSYLVELAELGVPIVPTRLCRSVEEVGQAVADTVTEVGVPQVVVKPNVSAGSRDTELHPVDSPAITGLAEKILADGKVVMVQPAIPSVAELGEVAHLHFDGVWSHALRKGPILAEGGGFLGGSYSEDLSAHEATTAEREVCAQAMAAIATVLRRRFALTEPLLYARIDLVAGAEGPLLLEAELFEPSYFLATAPGSERTVAEAIARRLAR